MENMKYYESKVIKVEEALAMVKSGDHIAVGGFANDPKIFSDNLHTIADRVENVTVTNIAPPYMHEYYSKEYVDSFNIQSLFYSGFMRKIHGHGNVEFVPVTVHNAYERLVSYKPNIFVCAASMPDEHGYVSLALSDLYESEAAKLADIVIIEASPNFPRTFGDVSIPMSLVDYVIEVDYYPPNLPSGEAGEVEKQIGKHLAPYIEDGSCLQIGIGGIPDALCNELVNKKDLGIHTEMLTNGVLKLIKSGAVTNMNKQKDVGRVLTCFALGDKDLYEYLDNNPEVIFRKGSKSNDPSIVMQNDNMISVNTTIEIDITGQCCSEAVGSRQVSGTGGQVDMVLGAQWAKNGKSFICLPSTVTLKNRETGESYKKSTIVSTFEPGSIVTLPRVFVDYVVTEYGVAKLKSASMKERIERLINIAHPDFKDDLLEGAKKLGYL